MWKDFKLKKGRRRKTGVRLLRHGFSPERPPTRFRVDPHSAQLRTRLCHRFASERLPTQLLCWSWLHNAAYAIYAIHQHRRDLIHNTVLILTYHNDSVRLLRQGSASKKHTHSCVDFHTAQCWRMHLRHGSASESPLTRSCVDSHRFVGVAPSCIAQWTGLSVFAPSCIAQCCTVNWFVFAPSCIAQWTGLSLSAPSCIAQWTGLSLFVQAALHSKLVCQCFI